MGPADDAGCHGCLLRIGVLTHKVGFFGSFSKAGREDRFSFGTSPAGLEPGRVLSFIDG
jgi:hypothetical protein